MHRGLDGCRRAQIGRVRLRHSRFGGWVLISSTAGLLRVFSIMLSVAVVCVCEEGYFPGAQDVAFIGCGGCAGKSEADCVTWPGARSCCGAGSVANGVLRKVGGASAIEVVLSSIFTCTCGAAAASGTLGARGMNGSTCFFPAISSSGRVLSCAGVRRWFIPIF